MEEILDIFDENGNPTGRVKEKKQAHADGEWHKTAHIWIINSKNELLLQRRSPNKPTHPNMWDISAAGHISAGESVLEGAVRELKEELGVSADKEQFKHLFTVKQNKNPKNREFAEVYLVKLDLPVSQYVFEDDEVAEVKYIPYKVLQRMVEEKAEGILQHEEEYRRLFEFLDKAF